jgi:RsiW-degrading membrane proteinase PrsW (M82 family)
MDTQDTAGSADRATGHHPTRRSATRRWGWALVLTVGIALFELVRLSYLNTGNPNLVPSLLLLGGLTGPTAFVCLIYGRRWRVDVTAMTVLVVALIGGVIGVATASVLEYHTLISLGALPAIAVAAIEEATKLIAPLALLLTGRYLRTVDGLLIGIASGAGFAVMETLGYSAVELIRTYENVGQIDGLLLERGLFSPVTHMAWTALLAAALWHAAAQRWRPRAVSVLLGAAILSICLHAAWDLASRPTAYLALAALSATALAATIKPLTHDRRPPAPSPAASSNTSSPPRPHR